MGVNKRLYTAGAFGRSRSGSGGTVFRTPNGKPGIAGTGVIVTGDLELDAKLSTLEKKVQKKVAKKSMRKAAKEIILPEAKNRVPVDSGALEESLVVRSLKRSRSRIGVEVRTKEGFFKGDEFYGGFIEFGTATQKAQPFLRPAGYGNEPRIRELIIQDIKQALREM